jgi:hypothetical protein
MQGPLLVIEYYVRPTEQRDVTDFVWSFDCFP